MATFDQNTPQSVEYYEREGPVHRSAKSPNKLVTQHEKGITNLHQALSGSFTKGGDAPCIGKRKLKDGKWGSFEWKSYKEVRSIFENFGSGLRVLGLSNKSHIGLYAKNRPKWAYSYLASIFQGIVVVPLYDTLGPEAITYVINHAELEIVISSVDNLSKLLAVSSECTHMKRIILLDPFGEKEVSAATKSGVILVSFAEVIKLGSENPQTPAATTNEDLFLIMYTSGTTGVPKGVMLTNANIIAALASIHHSGLDFGSTDVHLCYLPLAHIFELLCMTACFYIGAQVGFWRGDLQGLLEDIQALRPTILVGVPRVFNRIYDKIQSQLAQSAITRTLFNYAYNAKLTQLHNTGDESAPLWDRLVFSKMAALLGGRVRIIISGSAPLASNVQDFLRICFMCKVVQGYGLTETTGVLSLTDLNDIRTGHVGAPAISVEVKLVDVQEMNYTSSGKGKQQGEICVRGASVFKGYYKMPEKTAEDVDRNAWFHTGDIGEWLPNGTLRIIDRKKNIFKLAQGEYVAAEYLETVYLRSTFVMQVFVYGDSLKNYLVAVVVPDAEVLVPLAQQQGIKGELLALCMNDKVKLIIYNSLIKVADKAKLKGFEKVKNIHLEPEQWTVENGLLTPTFKAKRGELKKKYAEVIDGLYASPRMDAHVPSSKL